MKKTPNQITHVKLLMQISSVLAFIGPSFISEIQYAMHLRGIDMERGEIDSLLKSDSAIHFGIKRSKVKAAKAVWEVQAQS